MLKRLRAIDLLIVSIGFLVPYLLVFTYFYCTDGVDYFWQNHFIAHLPTLKARFPSQWANYLPVFYLVIGGLWTLVNVGQFYRKIKLQSQKYLNLLFASIPIIFLVILCSGNPDLSGLILIFIPIALFFAMNFMTIQNQPVADILQVLMILLTLFIQYRYIIVAKIG